LWISALTCAHTLHVGSTNLLLERSKFMSQFIDVCGFFGGGWTTPEQQKTYAHEHANRKGG
jgi:hypothetical protein